MNNDLPAIVGRLFNTPLLIDADKAAVIAMAVGPRLLGATSVNIAGSAENSAAFDLHSPKASILGDDLHSGLEASPGSGYTIYGGIAVIPVVGSLVRRGGWIGASSGMTSYEGVSALLRAAAKNPAVKGIALEIDSFGGEASGIFELGAEIREIREAKPVRAFVSDYALSAGYAIASQADHITAPEFGKVGSIGVVTMHADYSKKLDQDGVNITFIHAGRHKVDGNPYEPLADGVRERLQGEIDKMWIGFAELVEAGRGDRLSATTALKTEAQVYSGPEARARGLVDAVGDLRTAFKEFVAEVGEGSTLIQSPANGDTTKSAAQNHSSPGCDTAAVAASQKEASMAREEEVNTPEAEVTPAATPSPEGAVAAERERASKIMTRVEKSGLPASFGAKLVTDGVSLEAAYGAIIDEKAKRTADGGDIVNIAPRADVTSDAIDRTGEGMRRALYSRVGLDGGERNEFTSMSLREMARETLRVRGLAPRGGVMDMAGAAFVPSMAGGMHTTSDFGNILADVANKSMLKGFEETEESYQKFTSKGTMTDFKPTKKVGIDAFPSLLKVDEHAEFQYGKMGDHGETAMLATYGRLFAISRQTIINDDLDAFSKVPMKMGRAARRTVGDLVFAIMTGNPTMSDGTVLFHADHNNLAGSGAAPSEAAINAGITAMANQKDRGGSAQLNIPPKFILANTSQRSVILQSLNSEYAPDDTAKAGTAKQSMSYNTTRDAAEPIFDARISGNQWFLTADPNQFDTIEVAYLDGVETPFLDQQEGWGVDGTEFKVRLDAVAYALAWEALYKNPGL